MKPLKLLTLLLITTPLFARDSIIYVGNGKFDDAQVNIVTTECGTRTNPYKKLLTQHTIGTYFEALSGGTFTVISFHTLGFHAPIKTSQWWIEGFTGIGALSHSDNRLGGRFQFTEIGTLGYGKFGLSYQHISSAGIYSVNTGRDFILTSYLF